MPSFEKNALNIADLRDLARKRLTRALFDFCDKGSEDQVNMRANRTALDNIKLMPRMLRDVSGRDLSITLFEKEHALPLIIGPTGPAGFVWYRGETELARAAARANIPFTVASTSNTPLEDIYKNGGGTQWYQLYVWQDIDASLVTVNRALDAGYEALVLTVDSPVYNNREIDVRNSLKFPPTIDTRTALDVMLHPRWLFGTLAKYYFAEGQLPAFSNIHIPDEQKAQAKSYESAATAGFLNRNETLNWDFVKRLRDLWPKKLLIKCVLHPEDAAAAAACGVDGVFVSNHAGNVNDSAITAWDALPAISDAVGGKLTLIADTGIRRGSDVLKGLALGADVIAVGRATLYGVAAAGEAGATRALEILEAEIRRTMAVMGLGRISDISRDHIRLPADLPVSGQARL
ncbi:MAG: alpha-hydroxy-acid oxidizing enzyme [Rhodospirillaceae bacterium]|nr:alpha-hydroxy-acid oxidizing enzyme [Rhodospirillaceae bacterium]